MPIYKYKSLKAGCDHCRDGFEIMQTMQAKPLKKCPQCQGPVKKIPSVCSGYTPLLSDSNLRDKGFTKLVNKGNGAFEKTT